MAISTHHAGAREREGKTVRKRTARVWGLAAAAAAVLIFLAIGHIPIARVCPPLKAPDEIETITLRVNGLDIDGEPLGPTLPITDRDEMRTICGYLEGVHLAYMSPNAGIIYRPEEGDFLAILRLDGCTLYLKRNGDLYDAANKYLAKGPNVPALYRYLLERYTAAFA